MKWQCPACSVSGEASLDKLASLGFGWQNALCFDCAIDMASPSHANYGRIKATCQFIMNLARANYARSIMTPEERDQRQADRNANAKQRLRIGITARRMRFDLFSSRAENARRDATARGALESAEERFVSEFMRYYEIASAPSRMRMLQGGELEPIPDPTIDALRRMYQPMIESVQRERSRVMGYVQGEQAARVVTRGSITVTESGEVVWEPIDPVPAWHYAEGV